MKYAPVIGLIVALLPALTRAAPRQHVKASLLADVKAVKPGETFNVGVLLQIDPEWHIYWENPGESGAPTAAKISAPAGVTIGKVQYPLPMAFTQPGDIKGFGYEEQAMLIAHVTVPKDWPVGKEIDLTADVSWLNCKDICLPGKAKLDASVAVGQTREADNTQEFATWKPRLPIEDPDAAAIVKVTGGTNDLTLAWQQPVKEIEVMPVPPDGVEVASMVVDNGDKVTHIKPVLRLLGGEKKAGAALGLLVSYHDEAGQRHGVRLSMPIKKAGE
jgi:DsbC/DsbD-like thiol-disulfide interchange protein